MTSLAKIESNRRNALSSTGPRTPEGKERSRRNALRHGLAARTLVFAAAEAAADFSMFAADLRADLAPEGACEEALAQRIILCAWRLERVAHIEADILMGDARLAAEGTGLLPQAGIWPEEMTQIARYEATLDRAFARAMKMFHERQQARLAGLLPDAAEITERSQAAGEIAERSQIEAEITERSQADPHPAALTRGPLPLPLPGEGQKTLAGEGQKNPRPLAGEGAERSEAGEGNPGAADSAERSQPLAAGGLDEPPHIREMLDQRFARVRQMIEAYRPTP